MAGATPSDSRPMMRPQAPVRSAASHGSAPSRVAAKTRTPPARNSRTAAARSSARAIVAANTAPADMRATAAVTPHWPVVPINTSRTPKHSALRTIVPKFIGYWTRSRISTPPVRVRSATAA